MGIYIPNMKMPKSCLDCPMMVDRYDTDACALQSQEANEAFESWEDMQRNCPIVPLPEGHGRLADLDSIVKKLHEVEADFDKQKFYQGACWFHVTAEFLKAFPIIVPAEGGNADG